MSSKELMVVCCHSNQSDICKCHVCDSPYTVSCNPIINHFGQRLKISVCEACIRAAVANIDSLKEGKWETVP